MVRTCTRGRSDGLNVPLSRCPWGPPVSTPFLPRVFLPRAQCHAVCHGRDSSFVTSHFLSLFSSCFRAHYVPRISPTTFRQSPPPFPSIFVGTRECHRESRHRFARDLALRSSPSSIKRRMVCPSPSSSFPPSPSFSLAQTSPLFEFHRCWPEVAPPLVAPPSRVPRHLGPHLQDRTTAAYPVHASPSSKPVRAPPPPSTVASALCFAHRWPPSCTSSLRPRVPGSS